MDELSLDEREARARRAAELLANELYVQAWNDVEKAILDRWASSPIEDIDGQHELRLMLHVMRSVKTQIEHVVQDGKIATHEKKTRMQSLKDAVLRFAG